MVTTTEIILSAKDRTQQAFDAVEKRMSGLDVMGRTLGGTMGTLSGLFTVGTMAAWTKSAIDAVDAMGDLSIRTGISVEELSGWQYAVQLSDTSMEALSGALAKASKYLVDNADDLKKLGIEATNSTEVIVGLADVVSSMPVDDPRRMAVAMQVLGKSAAELMPLLSGGADEIRNMLERGRELNPVTQEMAERAGEFNDKLDEMKLIASSLGVTWANELLPSLNRGLELITALSKTGLGGLITQMELDSGDNLNKKLAETERRLKSLYSDREALSKDTFANKFEVDNLAIIERSIKLNEQAMQQMRSFMETPTYANTRIVELQDQLEGLGSRLAKLNAQGGHPGLIAKLNEEAKSAAGELAKLSGRVNAIPDEVPAKKAATSVKAVTDAGQKYIDQLNERIALVGKVGEAEQLVARIQSGAIKFNTSKQSEEALQLSKRLDLMQRQVEIAKQLENATASAQKEFQALNDSLFPDDAKAREYNEQLQLLVMSLNEEPDRLAASIERLNKAFYGDDLGDLINARAEQFESLTSRLYPDQAKANQYAADIALIEDQLASMSITAEQANDMVKRLDQQFAESGSQMSQFAIQAARNIQTSLGDTLYEGLNGNFDNIGDSFNRMLTRMAADLMASKAAEILFGSFGTNGSMGGLVGSFFGGSGGGNASPGISLTKNANGGVYNSPGLSSYSNSIVSSPTIFPFAKGAGLMGEAGPEAIMPLSRGANGKLGVQVAGGLGGVNVVVNVIGGKGEPQVGTSMGDDGTLTIDLIYEQFESNLVKRTQRGSGLAPVLEDKYGMNPAAGARG